MNAATWPALDTVLAALATAPSRTGSVIVTVYGDAVMPRGGALALADLMPLMRRLGATEGVVRTALSRLARDGLLEGRRTGRRSAYALTPAGTAEFTAAIPRIYGPPHDPPGPAWDGQLHLAFPGTAADRAALDAAGFVLLAPGILAGPGAAPPGIPVLDASGPAAMLRHVAARAWPLGRLRELYEDFLALFTPLDPPPDLAPLDAMAARIVLIHTWRRIALRDPHLPAALLPLDWPGIAARALCIRLDDALHASSERWLDAASSGTGLLPARGPTPRFDRPTGPSTPPAASPGTPPFPP